MNGKKEYVKLWVSYRTYFEPYTPEQVGNLALAMLAYKSAGEEPEFCGPERFIWPAIKRDIDEARAAQEAAAEQSRENGRKGGRPRKSPAETEEENPSGFSETRETTWTKDKDIDKDYGQGQGQEQGQGHTSVWTREKMSATTRLIKQLMRGEAEEAAGEGEYPL